MAVRAEPAFPAKTEAALMRREKIARRIMTKFLSERIGDSSGFFSWRR
jgi:hypothetical protein